MAKAKKNNTFKAAVDKCRELTGSYKAGLTALGANSEAIKASDNSLIDGSVDIDSALKAIRPNEARWDFAVGYSGEAFFVEVHPADTKNVNEMVNKVVWLKNWLASVAPDLKKLHKRGCYHWIPSGRVKILKSSSQYKKIAVNNLIIAKPLFLK